jgi:arylsulfatase A-like enzyme
LLAALCLCTTPSFIGCASESDKPAGEITEIGSIGLNLELSPGITVAEASYKIVGNGFKKEGVIDVTETETVRARIGGIPVGQGFRITLQATDSEDRTSAGSATFDITAGAVTNVSVSLRWPGDRRTGSVVVNGVFNVCPVIEELSGGPLTINVGGTVELTARASDVDGIPGPLTYAWSTGTGGQIGGATTPNATVTSATAGNRTVTLTVSDGDCVDSANVQLTFVDAPVAGAGGAGGTGGTGTGGGAAGTGGGQTQRNILLIIQDDYGAESSPLYPDLNGDSGAVATPNIERLAENGLVFDNAWSNPACSMTRSTILTGLYGHRTGVTFVNAVLPTTTTTLFDRVGAETAYDAALFGKYHVGPTVEHVSEIGIDTFRGILGGAISDYYNWVAFDVAGPAVRWSTYATTAITDFAVDHIREREAAAPDQPWFVYQAYNGSHSPFQVPPRELHSLDVGGQAPGTIDNSINNYKAIIQATDTEIGRLLAEVDLDETTVIYIGDNGTPGAQKDTGTGVRGSKGSAYEGGVRVPFVIAGAGVTRRGREDAIVNTADLYATILELAGLSIGHVNNSYSLKPLLTDENATSGRTLNVTESCNANNPNNNRNFAIRDSRFKIVATNGVYSLFDLQTDPLEATDLYNDPEYAAQRASLLAEIETLKASAITGCWQ